MGNNKKIFGLFATAAACFASGGFPNITTNLLKNVVESLAPDFAAEFLLGIDANRLFKRFRDPGKLNHFLDKLVIATSVNAIRIVQKLYIQQLEMEPGHDGRRVKNANEIFNEMTHDWRQWKTGELIDKEFLDNPQSLFNEICNYVFEVSSADRSDPGWQNLTNFFREKLPVCFEIAFKDAIVDSANEEAFKSYEIDLLRGLSAQNHGTQEMLAALNNEIERLKNGGSVREDLKDAIRGDILGLEYSLKNYIHQELAGLKVYVSKEVQSLARPASIKELTQIPRPAQGFIGRENEIAEIKTLLETNQMRLLVHGTGGIGKTAFLKKFAQVYYDRYDHIAWIEVKKQEVTTDDFATRNEFLYSSVLRSNLGLGLEPIPEQEKFMLICNRLSNLGGRNLLVIDNAQGDLSKEEIRDALPGGKNWDVIVSSRQLLQGFLHYELQELTPSLAKELMRSHCRIEMTEPEMEELLEEIGYHTLMIEIVSKTIAHLSRRISIRDIMNSLKKKEGISNEVEKRLLLVANTYESGIYATLFKTFSLTELSGDEITLLKQFSCLPPGDYDIELLSKFLNKENLAELLFQLASKGWLRASELSYNAAYSMHRIVHRMINFQLEPTPDDILPLVENMSELLYLRDDKEIVSTYHFIPYAEYVLDQISEEERNDPKVTLLENNLGYILMQYGDYDKARKLMRHALECDLVHYGEASYVVAIRRCNLGRVHKHLSEYETARELIDMAVQSDLNNFGDRHPNLLYSKSQLAGLYLDMGLSKLAKTIFQNILDTRMEIDSPAKTIAWAHSDLAAACRVLGELEEAKIYSQLALDTYLNHYGEGSGYVASERSNLAWTLRKLGEHLSAKNLIRQSLDFTLSHYGDRHIINTGHWATLFAIHFDLGEYPEAKTLMETIIKVKSSYHGDDFPELYGHWFDLGEVNARLRNYDEALNYFSLAYKKCFTRYGASHEMLGELYGRLANLYKENNKFLLAKITYQNAVDFYLQKEGEHMPLVAYYRLLLADIYKRTGSVPESIGCWEKVFSYYESSGESNYELMVAICYELCWAYRLQNNISAAVKYISKGIRIASTKVAQDSIFWKHLQLESRDIPVA